MRETRDARARKDAGTWWCPVDVTTWVPPGRNAASVIQTGTRRFNQSLRTCNSEEGKFHARAQCFTRAQNVSRVCGMFKSRAEFHACAECFTHPRNVSRVRGMVHACAQAFAWTQRTPTKCVCECVCCTCTFHRRGCVRLM